MRIAIVGGGINGLCVAWQLASDGHLVSLYEKGAIMRETSAASTKLLHGGLRYLEHGSFRLVKEALSERAWWLSNVPHIAHPIELFLPIYHRRRSRALIKSGLLLYDLLAGRKNIASHSWCNLSQTRKENPQLNPANLHGGYRFYDGQMDDYALGLWVAEQARTAGAKILENTAVNKITINGEVQFETGKTLQFDRVINITGPWVGQLLNNSNIHSEYKLDLVRGSHLLLQGQLSRGYFLEHPVDQRMFFVLPYQGQILLGTTEIRQTIDELNHCSVQERNYLLDAYNAYFSEPIGAQNIISEFSGLRPLLRSAVDPGKASREYAIERNNVLINVWGGKWTTTRALARKVAERIN